MDFHSLKDFILTASNGVPSYVGNGLLPKDGRMLLGGQPGIGKSVFALNMAYHLASGTDLFGFQYKDHNRLGEPVLPVHGSCRVLYIDKEIGEEGLKSRLAKLHTAHQSNTTAADSFFIAPRSTELCLDQPTHRSAWEELLQNCQPDVVFLDPIVGFHNLDENNAEAMTKVVHALDDLIDSYHFSVVLIHHFGKPYFGREGQIIDRGLHRFRGSSVLTSWPDTRLTLDLLPQRGSSGAGSGWKLELKWLVRQGPPVQDMTVTVLPTLQVIGTTIEAHHSLLI